MPDQRKGGIAWTDETWNPVTGCSKVSLGCAHCYAETVAKRFWPMQYVRVLGKGFIPVRAYDGETVVGGDLRQFTDVQCHEDRLDQPLRWKRPRMVFVNSMSDLFHPDVPDAFIDQVFAVMALAQWHTFQILTKRPERMLAYLSDAKKHERWAVVSEPFKRGRREHRSKGGWTETWWPKYAQYIWLGVSVEDQKRADERIPLLLQTPAAIRFVSAEPLLGSIDFREDDLCRLSWVIIGGESGPKARPCDVAWIRSIVAQCKSVGVPVFVKQLGSKPVQVPYDTSMWVVKEPGALPMVLADRKGSDMAEWPADLRVREFPEARD